MIKGPLRVFCYDGQAKKLVRKVSGFKDPRIVKITPYSKFSCNIFRQNLSKLLARVRKETDQIKG